MAADLPTRPQLTPDVLGVLAALRGRIRWYVWLEGLATGAAWLGIAFWLSLAIDWFFEPPVAVRQFMLAAVGCGLAVIVFHLIGRRAFVRLSDGNMATLLERRFPTLGDSLLTAVVLTGRETPPDECNPEMLSRTCREASQRIGGLRLAEVFDPRPLTRSAVAALVLTASVAAFAALAPDGSRTWARRTLLFSDELWPRKSHLAVEPGVFPAKVARGADFRITALADTSCEVIPKSVQVRFRTKGRPDAVMSREGAADPAKDQYQVYSYVVRGILTPVRFDLVGGDSRIRDLRVDVVDSPTIVEMTLDCKYPAYLDRAPRSLRATGAEQIPRGTEVTVRARANKDLTKVQIDTATGDRADPVTVLSPKKPVREFRHTIPSLAEDTTLLFTLSDTDGITTREPVRLSLAALADAPPELSAQLDGIGQAVTPDASVPVKGTVTDDWAVAKVWFETSIDEREPAEHPIASPPDHVSSFPLDAALDVERLRLAAGQKLVLGVKASDRCDLDGHPNVGAGERWLLDIVTPAQLRSMLEARELVLRQRFETTIEEMTETRDLLLRLDFADSGAGDAPAASAGPAMPKKKPDAEPGDEPDDAPDRSVDSASAARPLERRMLRVGRALTNARKSTYETQGVADSFDDIRKQLVNNRIDSEELKSRLADGIVAPLNRVAREMFPELERRLVALQEKLDDRKLGPARADRARRQADDILLVMRTALGRMIELEDFNEAVELLRSIIEMQERLGDETKQRHKQKLRDLLEK